jgi:hypothetical protein
VASAFGRARVFLQNAGKKVIEQAEAGAAPSSVVLPGAGLPQGGPTPCSPWVLGPKRLRACLEEAVAAAAKAAGLGVRRSTIGCSGRKCRLQKLVRGILPALSRWAARHIKRAQGRAMRRSLPRQRRDSAQTLDKGAGEREANVKNK